jgi:hypothetical protein
VVSDVVHDDLRAEPIAEIYVPFAQFPLTRIFLAVRGVTGPVLLPAIRAAVADVDPEQPVYSVRMMEERVAQSIAPQRATSLLITTFSLLALVLASIGLYGVIAYGVRIVPANWRFARRSGPGPRILPGWFFNTVSCLYCPGS